MFYLGTFKINLIACKKNLLRGKSGYLVNPSQLSEKWFSNRFKANTQDINLLYIGRIKIEKGTDSLFQMLENIKINLNFTIVSTNQNLLKLKKKNNYKYISFSGNHDSLIKIYDDHNIFILPSFTEAHPQVLDESLSRLRPVIIFEEISHVIGEREGVFVAKRNSSSLLETINYIIKNYNEIQEKMKRNSLPTKKEFINKMMHILN